MRRASILIILAVFFAGYIFSAARMEQLRANGTDVLLALAPVDPRALLMGDYMELEYTVNNAIRSAVRPTRGGGDSEGRAVLRLDRVRDSHGGAAEPSESPRGEAVFARLDDGSPLADGEVFIQFKLRGGEIRSAASAFYFQEGRAALYEGARFGRVKVDGNGKTLLVTLCDAKGMDIAPEEKP